MCSADIFLGVLAILFPPLPVWVKCGICSADSLINILLCCLGFIPGLFHAWYIIAKFPEPPYEYEAVRDREDGRVTYVYVQPPHNQHQPNRMNYGGTDAAAPQNNNNSSAPPPPRAPQAPQQQGVSGQAGASDGQVPPSYADVVGDHKVQRD
ncbi:hypothetical protein K4F52_001678 [Lecanicillium sp. MT-2017a]|nr:hypothetical protein K4F52_001678 [Lecanicillium sp. MT-2017a]